MLQKNLYVRLAAVGMLFLVLGVSLNGRDVLAEQAPAQPEADLRLTHPSAVIGAQAPLAQAPSYSAYTRITDNEEKITVQVPVEWTDIETGTWAFKGRNEGVFLAASLNLASFYSTGAQPGMLIGVSRSLARTYSKEGLLEIEKRDLSRQCVHRGRFDYQNQFYSGQYDHFSNCSGTPGLMVFTTITADQKSLIMIRIAVVSQADLEAVDTILSSFQVLGDPESDEHHDE